MKNTLLFTYSTNILVCLLTVKINVKELSYPKNQKMCNPILVTLLKMWPHYSQSSHQNATLSSGISPLAPCKEGPPSCQMHTRGTSWVLFLINSLEKRWLKWPCESFPNAYNWTFIIFLFQLFCYRCVPINTVKHSFWH